jgi:hypothetical protein
MVVAWPRLLPASDLAPSVGPGASAIAFGAGLAGAILIAGAPWLASLVIRGQSGWPIRAAAVAELMLVGGFLGDHAAIAIGLDAAVLYHTGWAAPLTLATLSWMLAWPDVKPIDPPWFGTPHVRLVLAMFLTAIFAALILVFTSRGSEIERP